VRLGGSGPDDIDALRALCASWWARHSGDGAPPATVQGITDAAAAALNRWAFDERHPRQGSEQRRELDQVEHARVDLTRPWPQALPRFSLPA